MQKCLKYQIINYMMNSILIKKVRSAICEILSEAPEEEKKPGKPKKSKKKGAPGEISTKGALDQVVDQKDL